MNLFNTITCDSCGASAPVGVSITHAFDCPLQEPGMLRRSPPVASPAPQPCPSCLLLEGHSPWCPLAGGGPLEDEEEESYGNPVVRREFGFKFTVTLEPTFDGEAVEGARIAVQGRCLRDSIAGEALARLVATQVGLVED